MTEQARPPAADPARDNQKSTNGRVAAWGSDVIADALVATGITHIALTPGASFRGLHDSIVNYLADEGPSMLICLHEEHSVAIAHGYAKVTGSPMAVAVHSNVGLMHASMAMYNAYCDRVPMMVVGATGPVDATQRRPWIDWIHTSADQGMLVRPYVKWDDQPASIEASVDSILQGSRITQTRPQAPVYVCLDVAVQEQQTGPLGERHPRPSRVCPIPDAVPAETEVDRARAILLGAERPVVLMGRVGRCEEDWERRVALVERLGARVITDSKLPVAFPNQHPLLVGPPSMFLSQDQIDLLGQADVVLSLDWNDLAGTLRTAGALDAAVVSASVDHHLHNGWSKDAYGPAPVDVSLGCTPEAAVRALLGALDNGGHLDRPTSLHGGVEVSKVRPDAGPDAASRTRPRAAGAQATRSVADLTATLLAATRGRETCLIRIPFAWNAGDWPLVHPLDSLGLDGGGGVGSGPGMAVGAALALEGTGRLPVAILGDGDFLMGATALWTASNHQIPLLVVVANNTSFYNDEMHQLAVAKTRGRPQANASIGVRLDSPSPDLAGLARSLGFDGIGPIEPGADLAAVLRRAVNDVAAGGRVLVDVRVEAGYAASTTNALTTDAVNLDENSPTMSA